MTYGASISSNNGQAIIEACRGGSVEVLDVLLTVAFLFQAGAPNVLDRGTAIVSQVLDDVDALDTRWVLVVIMRMIHGVTFSIRHVSRSSFF